MLTSRKNFLRQTGFALAGSCLPLSSLLAKVSKPPHVNSIDTKHPKDCTQDLRNPLFTYAPNLIYADFQYHKGTYPGVVQDVIYPTEGAPCTDTSITTKTCDPTDHHFYGTGDPDNNISILRYRAFYRKSTYEDSVNGHDYDAVPLPCVVLFHPGGFQECPDYLTPGLVTICQALSARGYIAITVGYRGGRILDPNTSTIATRTSAQQQLAIYRAIQDRRGAIRSIMKRSNPMIVDNHTHQFRINEDQFFIGGLSAGAITAVSIAYYRSQTMINQVFPSASSSLTIQQALGHINADNYYGDTGADLNNPTYWPVIRGVLNCWGGISIPKSYDGTSNPDNGASESGFFAGTGSQINPPVIGFAGAQDKVVYFDDDNTFQNVLNSKVPAFRNESVCLATSGTYTLKDTGSSDNLIFVKQCSAQNLYYILKDSSVNRFAELYVDCNMHHGIMNPATDNFGVYVAGAMGSNIATEDDVNTYIAIRAAIFFQTIMNVPITAAFPNFGYRGKSLFRSTDDTSHITNQRICTDCDGIPSTDTCNLPDDPECTKSTN